MIGSYHTSTSPTGAPGPSATPENPPAPAQPAPDGAPADDPAAASGPAPGPTAESTADPAGAAPQKDVTPEPVPQSGSGQVRVAQFTRAAPAEQQGRRVRVRVEVENEMPVDPDQVATQAATILQDKRSWPSKQKVRFDFVGGGTHDLVIRVLTPATTDKRCYPLRTNGRVSCSTGSAVNLNGHRWTGGIPDYAGDLTGYRTYLVNHEVGHYLGLGHVECPGRGQPAPVMMQQTYGLDGCARNPWP
ncbi:DUF3152 domain-containing protein [Ammonicoccus fulvus]|uniref:DUF3152 domain-containing protein n=1 Tax=Ammonicoccus fulvus TaxID=3138240 RepID=A0ABZ3FWV8_9ACTN